MLTIIITISLHGNGHKQPLPYQQPFVISSDNWHVDITPKYSKEVEEDARERESADTPSWKGWECRRNGHSTKRYMGTMTIWSWHAKLFI